MNTKLESSATMLDVISKVFNVAFKFSTLLGAMVIFIYCSKIGYYPTNLSLGDALLFVLTATIFGLFYIGFTLFLLSTGMVPMYPLQRLIFFLLDRKEKPEDRIRISGLIYSNFVIYFLFGLLVVFLIITVRGVNWFILGIMALISLGIGTLFNIGILLSKKLSQLQRQRVSKIENPIHNLPHFEQRILLGKSALIMLICTILVLPMVVSEVVMNIVNATMSVVHIRENNVDVYVTEPYSILIEHYVEADTSSPKIDKHKKFSNVDILFGGIGKDVFLQLPDTSETTLSVPNDKIITGPLGKKSSDFKSNSNR